MPHCHTFPCCFLRKSLGALLVFGLVLGLSMSHADEPVKRSLVPAAVEKAVPESLDDLKAIQKQVRKVLEKVVPCTVGLRIPNAKGNGFSSGSGVIINAEGFILTAGHVSEKPGRDCVVIFQDGKEVKGKTLGYNKNIDSGMVKIVDEGKWPFAEMGKSADLKKGQWVICTGHPGGYKIGRTPVVRLGRVLDVDADEIRTDCTLVGGDSGGPLFDMQGKVVGIHSRIGEAPRGSPSVDALKQNIHVPVDTYHETYDRLVAGESWGSLRFTGRATRPWLGLTVDVDNKKECKVIDVVSNGPSAKAGIKTGDTILKFDGRPVGDSDDLDIVLKRKKPDEVVELEIKRGDETLTMKLTIGKKS